MLSYAQNAEDVVLERAFADVEEGFYIDVGASVPEDDSVTFHFYLRGWHGVNVEPDADDYEQLSAARDRDVNLRAAVGPGEEPLDFYPSVIRGHGTVDPGEGGDRRDSEIVQVPQISLARIFDQYAPPAGVDFLKVDVEGWEAKVLASGDWERHRPRVVLVEAVDATGNATHETWEPALLAVGYIHALFDGVNRFYSRDEDAARLLPRLSAPANVLDNWRQAGLVEAQHRLQAKIAELEAAVAEQSDTRRMLEAKYAAAVAEQSDTRRMLEAERQAHEETQQALEAEERLLASVYDSTSWRITSPVRDASRLARLMRRGSVA